MKILALDTSMGACSAALLCARDSGRRLYAEYTEMPRGHAEALMPMVAGVMAEAGIGVRDLDRIAATVGPGSFTGVRVAIAAARGLALTTDAKLFGTDSLSVMAHSVVAEAEPDGDFAVAVDARRGMLYCGLYGVNGQRLDGPLLIAPKEAALRMPSVRLAAGSGAALLADAAASEGREIEAVLLTLQPRAAALAEIAFETNEASAIFRPLYLRPPDAKPQAQAIQRC